ncbi:MAG: MgtC/SapB family protein [Clostridia bacterium]|nr:MgtC/SapB family protein [Clostridia bacterium]
MFLVDIWNWFVETASAFGMLSIVIRLLLAMIVGLVIGIDREMKRRVAGIKTHILVCVGAAMVMITSQYMLTKFGTGDPARLGAQVISGVGFLGVGTIIVTGRNQVRGLTTAASIWTCACLGLAAGIGFVEGVVVALVFIVFTLKVLGKLDKVVQKRAREIDFYIEFENNEGLNKFSEKMKEDGNRIVRIQVGKCEGEEEHPNALVNIRVKDRDRMNVFFAEIRQLSYVRFVEEL